MLHNRSCREKKRLRLHLFFSFRTVVRTNERRGCRQSICYLAYFTGDCIPVTRFASLCEEQPYFRTSPGGNDKSPKIANAPSNSRTSPSRRPHGEEVPAHSMSDSLLWIQLGPILLLPCGFGIGIYPAYSCPDTSAIRSALAMPILFCAIHPTNREFVTSRMLPAFRI